MVTTSMRNLEILVLLVGLQARKSNAQHRYANRAPSGSVKKRTSPFSNEERGSFFFFNRFTGENGLCVIGCTPYVDFSDPQDETTGIRKYERLVEDIVKDCDVIVHAGDTKPGSMPCNRTLMTWSVHRLREEAKDQGKLLLYAPGDNELNDCHRFASRAGQPVPADIYKASDARQYLIDNLQLNSGLDLTGTHGVDNHDMSNTMVPGTSQPHSCDFDKYVELDNYAVATLEVPGSHYYLDDETSNQSPNYSPKQNHVDPLEGRLSMFLNANGCTLDWIDTSAAKASGSKKRALFFIFHALFHSDNGRRHKGSHGIGEHFSSGNLLNLTNGAISEVYKPLFDKLTETAKLHSDLMMYVVHADGHRFSTMRMNPSLNNSHKRQQILSNHNLMLHMVEGDSRSLTTYSKFTVDNESFQPVALKEQWSRAAFDEYPKGHSW